MTPPEDESASSGGEPSSSSEESNGSTEENDRTQSLQWTPDSDNDVGIIVRGSPESYDLHFILIVRLDPDRSTDRLEEIVPIGTDDPGVLYDFDLDVPPQELRNEVIETRAQLDKQGSALDSELVRQKFDNLFNSVLRGDEIIDKLKENPVSEVIDFLEEEIRNETFPGTTTKPEVKIHEWIIPEEDEEEFEGAESTGENGSGDSDDTFETGRRLLTITPCVSPLRGREIGRLRPGDMLEVRVIGDSVRKLRDEYLDENSTEDNPYSRPLQAKLIEQKEGETPQDVAFLVRLGEGIYGQGSVPQDTKVLSNEQLIEGVGPFSSGYGRYLFIALVIAVLVVSFLLFTVQ